jgi:hypothetical protein
MAAEFRFDPADLTASQRNYMDKLATSDWTPQRLLQNMVPLLPRCEQPTGAFSLAARTLEFCVVNHAKVKQLSTVPVDDEVASPYAQFYNLELDGTVNVHNTYNGLRNELRAPLFSPFRRIKNRGGVVHYRVGDNWHKTSVAQLCMVARLREMGVMNYIFANAEALKSEMHSTQEQAAARKRRSGSKRRQPILESSATPHVTLSDAPRVVSMRVRAFDDALPAPKRQK